MDNVFKYDGGHFTLEGPYAIVVVKDHSNNTYSTVPAGSEKELTTILDKMDNKEEKCKIFREDGTDMLDVKVRSYIFELEKKKQ